MSPSTTDLNQITVVVESAELVAVRRFETNADASCRALPAVLLVSARECCATTSRRTLGSRIGHTRVERGNGEGCDEESGQQCDRNATFHKFHKAPPFTR